MPAPSGMRRCACFGAALLALVTQTAMAQVTLDTPRGGWRNTANDEGGFMQAVNYPASSVNASGQPASALIRGHIANAGKQKPGTLIVNGVAMPISTDEGGNFQRPYSFGNGSNSIEVRSGDGKHSKRVQFYDGYATKPRAKLRVVLGWDTDGTDLDLHVVSPDGAHVFYGNRVAANGGALDVDVTTGYGPEIYANTSPPPGTYLVYVNYYGSGSGNSDVTTAQVTIISNEGTVSEKRETVSVPMRKAGELTLIKAFVYK